MSYPYANGVIATIDLNQFSASKLSKLNELEGNDFVRALSDMNYGAKGATVEKLIENEMKSVKERIDEVTPDSEMSNLFFLFNDTTIIKAYLKIKYFDLSEQEINNPLGNIDSINLRRAIYEGDFDGLPRGYHSLLTRILIDLGEYENSLNGDNLSSRVFSAVIDKAIFKFLKSKLRFTKQTALVTYFKAYADTKNLLSFIRAKRLGWKWIEFEEMFINYGKIKLNQFKNIYDSTSEEIVKSLEIFYLGKITKILNYYFENENLDILERSFDSLILDLMREYKYDSFGIGPIIYYYLVKNAETKNILLLYASIGEDVPSLIEY